MKVLACGCLCCHAGRRDSGRSSQEERTRSEGLDAVDVFLTMPKEIQTALENKGTPAPGKGTMMSMTAQEQ